MPAAPALAEGLADYIRAIRASRAPPGASPEAARIAADLHADIFAYPRPPGMTVATSFFAGEAGETPFRIYRPAGPGRNAIVYFHGGGFTTGSIESHDPLAAALAEAADATVISVHYARLPQATPRAILDQCHDALCRTAEMAGILDIDPARIAIAGDSAGAFIATLVAMMARAGGSPAIACQLLAYGSYDLDDTRDSYRAARDPILTTPVARAMIDTYHACDARDPAALPAPLRCNDLTGLPPAFLLGAEHDPLLDEGCAYARRLREAGVAVELRIAPAMPHGFLRAVRFSAPAREEMRRIGAFARSHF